MLSLLCFSLTLVRQPATVTYETVAKPVAKVLIDLSKISGVKLSSVGVPANEPVIVYLKDVSLKDTMEKLGTAVLGRWKASGDGYVLESDPVKVRAAEAEELEQRIEDCKKTAAEFERSLREEDKPEPTPPDAESARDIDIGRGQPVPYMGPIHGFPISKLGMRLFCGLDPHAYAGARPGTKLVFCDKPAGSELPLGEFATKVIALYVSERQAFQEESLRRGDPVEGPYRHKFPRCVRLILKTSEHQQTVSVAAQFGDDEDERCRLTSIGEEDPGAEATQSSRVHNQHRIELSKTASAVVDAASNQEVTASVRTILLDPAQYDPLSYVISESLIQVAKNRNKNLIADVGDDLAYSTSALDEAGEWCETFLDRLVSQRNVSVSSKDDWLVVQSSAPASAQRYRVNRAELGDLLKALEPDRLGFTEKLAQFAYDHRGSIEPALMDSIFVVLHQSWIDWYPDELTFYGSLSDVQREYLKRQKALTYRDLSEEQRDMLVALDEVSVQELLGQNPALPADRRGVPMDLSLSLSDRVQIAAVDIEPGIPMVQFTPDAYYRFQTIEYANSDSILREIQTQKFVPAEQRDVEFRVHACGTDFEFSLTELSGRHVKPIPIASFPKKFFDEAKASRGLGGG